MSDPSPATRSPKSGPHQPGLLQRCALGLWFCAIGALGLLRFAASYLRHGEHAGDTVMWLWLVGSSLVGAIGLALVIREFKARATAPRD